MSMPPIPDVSASPMALVPLERAALAIPEEVTIPRDIEEAGVILDAVGGLLSAGFWGTAAIVYAFSNENGRDHKGSWRLSFTDFAEIGIRGLTKRTTVAKYWKAWQYAMDQGVAEKPEPGRPVKLPPHDFKAPGADPHVSNNAGDNEWYTPPEYVEAARAVLGAIDLDPASSEKANEVVGAERIYTEEDNGLDRPWTGRVWMNPPYAQPACGDFAKKLVECYDTRAVEAAVVLVNNATETQWFTMMAKRASAVCFPLGRVKFWHPEKEATPLQGQAILYLGNDPDAFIEAFDEFGTWWRRG